jgi:signal transduction histidine kinase
VTVTALHVAEESWERRERMLLRITPLAVLGIATLITLLQPVPLGSHLRTILIVAGVAAAWVLALDTLNPSWERHRAFGVGYYVGLLALAAILVVLMPWYGIFAFAGYLRAFDCLTGIWRFVGIGANALVISFSQIGGVYGLPYTSLASFIVVAAMNMLLAGAFGYFGWRTIERDRNRKQALAELAAALEENAGLHAQLLTQAREAGVLDERQRMAREIHDTLAQGLTGIVTQLEAAAQNPETWQRYVSTAEGLARESLSDARRSVHAIRPEALENARLPEALADVVRRWSEINGVAAEITVTGAARPLHPEVEVTLLRTAQESLTNVAKHAAASRVGLTLSYMEDLVTLDVRDDGIGFTHANGSGFGLTAMRQRVEGLAGRLEIESGPGAGTAISATIPAEA